VQTQIAEKGLKFYVIDANSVARAAGAGGRINTIMQTCFFAISGVLPREEAIAEIKKAIKKTYGRKGDHVVRQNYAAVDAALAGLHPVAIPAGPFRGHALPPVVADAAPDFVKRVTATMLAGERGPAPGERVYPGWDMAARHGEMGEAQYCRPAPGLGDGPLHPVQQVRLCLPARGHPRKILPGGCAALRAGWIPEHEVPGLDGSALYAPGGAGGLHRMHVVRDGVPREGQVQREPQGAHMAVIPERSAERKQYEFFLALPNPTGR